VANRVENGWAHDSEDTYNSVSKFEALFPRQPLLRVEPTPPSSEIEEVGVITK
jgi:hypothetical protein